MFSQSMEAVFSSVAEIDVHPHVEEERADLFRAVDIGSAELEILNFLNALIYLYKPRNVLETGTHRGFSAIAIASALKMNGFGKLHTLEYYPMWIDLASRNIEMYDRELVDYIEIHCTESTEWLKQYQGQPFDFAFFDSSLSERYVEFEITKKRGLFSPEAFVMFHDTSRHRGRYFDDYAPEMLSSLDDAARDKQRLDFNLSRGFRLFRVS